MLAPRRFWQEAAADFGVKTYGYLFTEPMLADPPALASTFIPPFVFRYQLAWYTATHAVDLTFVYGGLYYKPRKEHDLCAYGQQLLH